MLQVSRDSNLKIPKKLETTENKVNSIEDKVAVKAFLGRTIKETLSKLYER